MQSASAWRIIFGAIVLGLVGCSGSRRRGARRLPDGAQTTGSATSTAPYGATASALFQRGTGQFAREDGADGGAYAGIGVNAYLWRAALETLDFLPLTQADPFGGVIITDWYSPERPDERFKLNVYILDSRTPGRWRQGRRLPPDQRRQRLAGRGGRSADLHQHRGQHSDAGARAAHRRPECQRLTGCRQVRPVSARATAHLRVSGARTGWSEGDRPWRSRVL